MNTRITLAVAALAAAIPASATLLTHDSFDYPVGSLNSANGGIGWGSAWESQDSGQPYAVANSSPLTFGSLLTSGNYGSGGFAYTNLGRRLQTGSLGAFDSAGLVSNPFASPDPRPGLIDGGADGLGVVWMSILLRRDANPGGNFSIGLYKNGTIWSDFGTEEDPSVSFGLTGGNWVLSNGKSLSAPVAGTVPNVLGDEFLLVTRIEFNGANSSAHLWVNPTGLGGIDPSLGTATASITGRTLDEIAFRNVQIYIDNSPNQGSFDEIRLGTTFASVTPIPEPSTVAAILGALTLGVLALRRRRS
jgi:hypothetical protein